jgi:hypothetical protein
MNPALHNLIKLLAKIAVEKYLDEECVGLAVQVSPNLKEETHVQSQLKSNHKRRLSTKRFEEI